jgi:hypothetical protein
VVLFLELVRRAHADRRLVYRRTRAKNEATLFELGWLPRDLYECVASLQPEQALGLPRDNRNPLHVDERVCEFGTAAQGRDIYIKVSAVSLDDGCAGCVISFHFAEQPLRYPYRD